MEAAALVEAYAERGSKDASAGILLYFSADFPYSKHEPVTK